MEIKHICTMWFDEFDPNSEGFVVQMGSYKVDIPFDKSDYEQEQTLRSMYSMARLLGAKGVMTQVLVNEHITRLTPVLHVDSKDEAFKLTIEYKVNSVKCLHTEKEINIGEC